MYPIEKFGWEYDSSYCMEKTEIRFERKNNKEYLIFNRTNAGIDIQQRDRLSFEELQAIYETAVLIRQNKQEEG